MKKYWYLITKSLSKENLIYHVQTTTIHISLTLACLQARYGLAAMWARQLQRVLVVIMLGEKRKRKAKDMTGKTTSIAMVHRILILI